MTLTPADVSAVTFRTALRGYHMGEVDAFLDRVATALARLGQENARLRAAVVDPAGAGDEVPGRLPRPLPGESGEEAALRTLLLAQRTADQVVTDAREEGVRVVEAARAEVVELFAEAEARLNAVELEVDERRAEALAELAEERERLELEVAQLREFEREYRTRLRSHLESSLREIAPPAPGSPAWTD